MALTVQTSINYSIASSDSTARIAGNSSITETTSGNDAVGIPAYTVTTSWTAIPLGALASFKKVFIKNLDSTNFIQVAADGSGTNKLLKIVALDTNLFTPDPSLTLYWKADTASCLCTLAANEP